MGSLKGKIDYMKKKKRLIVHANMNLRKRCVNETVLHAKFLYLIYKKNTHYQRFYQQHQAKLAKIKQRLSNTLRLNF